MKQKIDWYREVLELEPGSRVFFPLAKLLAADGQAAEAVLTLKQGLLRHPDNVEARLLLVELLHLQQADAEVAAEIERLGKILASYPGFWSAWCDNIADNPLMRDASLAMRFFSAALQGKSISWGDIISRGLNAVLSAGETATGSGKSYAGASPHIDEKRTADASAGIRPAEASAVLQTAIAAPAANEAEDEPGLADDEEETDEPFSLRTRSMADVLAEQGDVQGALDIYQELLQSAAEEEKLTLAQRIDELSRRLNNAGTEPEVSAEKAFLPGSESLKIVNLMESLAERLEARAR
ncbi:MAG: tetratricopeptide repeat-containing protein [Desulfovibrio sp.]|jgi:tetratricopeptide (TPR) repeat protein|nr:tetratricopeptide repeat-containing protein [Desulfovibrio sp.]